MVLPHLLLLQVALVFSVFPRSAVTVDANLTLAVFLSGLERVGDGFTGNLDGCVFQEAAKLALEQANNNSDLLSEYNLGARYQDGQVCTTIDSGQCTVA